MQQLPVPTIAPDFRAPQKPLPELNRVGVDMNRQRPLSLRDALSMALENNKDIEVARENVRIAEFDLLGAQGVYDPRFTTSAFYERIEESDLEFPERRPERFDYSKRLHRHRATRRTIASSRRQLSFRFFVGTG